MAITTAATTRPGGDIGEQYDKLIAANGPEGSQQLHCQRQRQERQKKTPIRYKEK